VLQIQCGQWAHALMRVPALGRSKLHAVRTAMVAGKDIVGVWPSFAINFSA